MNLVQILASWYHGSSIDDIRRVLTPLFIVLDVVLIGVFAAAAVLHWKRAPYHDNLALQASLSLGTYFFGQLLTRVWGWFILYQARAEGGVSIVLNWNPALWVALIGSLISVGGAAWATYVFTPSNWRVKGWLLATIAVALFVGLTRFL